MLTATEFRARLDRLGLPRQEAADRLGLSLNGLFHQMRDRPVSRQTELLLAHLEREQARHKRRPRSRQRPVAAALALALVIAVPTFAGERDVSEATPAFDWDRCHDRQDACREADRIAAACTQGHCDELALRQANEAGVLGLHGRAPMNDTAKIRRFEIRAQWDTEASVWWCSNDQLPLTTEASTFGKLVARVAAIAPEIAVENGLAAPGDRIELHVTAERVQSVAA